AFPTWFPFPRARYREHSPGMTAVLLLPVAFLVASLDREVDRQQAALAADAHLLRAQQIHHRLVVAEGVFERVGEALRVLGLVHLDLREAQRVRRILGDAMGVVVGFLL